MSPTTIAADLGMCSGNVNFSTDYAGLIGIAMAALTGLPRRGLAVGNLTVNKSEGREIWIRQTRRTWRTTLERNEGQLVERLGPFQLNYQVTERGTSRHLNLERLRITGIPIGRPIDVKAEITNNQTTVDIQARFRSLGWFQYTAGRNER